MLLEMPVAKGKKVDPAAPPVEPTPAPAGDDGDHEYTEPIKIPLWFKQKLEQIAQKANQERKRKDKSARKLPLGYFVVQQLKDWVNLAAEGLE